MYEGDLEGEVSAYMKVEKADGRILYYKTADGQTTEITQEEFNKETA